MRIRSEPGRSATCPAQNLEKPEDAIATRSRLFDHLPVALEQLSVDLLEQRQVQAPLVAEVVHHRRALDADFAATSSMRAPA
jgi:hypothetical protein